MSKPYKVVYGIRKTGITDEDGNERTQWTEIGVAFVNQDDSLTVVFNYLPTDLATTRIHIRDPKPKEEAPAAPDATPAPPPRPEQPQPAARPVLPQPQRRRGR